MAGLVRFRHKLSRSRFHTVMAEQPAPARGADLNSRPIWRAAVQTVTFLVSANPPFVLTG
jgi:hypothetical protein